VGVGIAGVGIADVGLAGVGIAGASRQYRICSPKEVTMATMVTTKKQFVMELSFLIRVNVNHAS